MWAIHPQQRQHPPELHSHWAREWGEATTVMTKIVILWTTLFSALQCEPYTLSSANTRQNCADTGNGSYSCSFTCQSGYAFYEDYGAETFTTTCDPGQPWSPSYIPSCVREYRLLLWLKITFLPGSITASLCWTLHSFLCPWVQAAALIKDYISSWVRRCAASLCRTLRSFLCLSVQDAFLIKDYIPSCVHECRLLLWLKITFLPGSIAAGCFSD